MLPVVEGVSSPAIALLALAGVSLLVFDGVVSLAPVGISLIAVENTLGKERIER